MTQSGRGKAKRSESFFFAEKYLNEEDGFRSLNKAFDFDIRCSISFQMLVYFNHDQNRSQTLSK